MHTNLEPDYNWGCQVEFTSRSNNTLSNDVTTHNTAENIDQDGVHLNLEKMVEEFILI